MFFSRVWSGSLIFYISTSLKCPLRGAPLRVWTSIDIMRSKGRMMLAHFDGPNGALLMCLTNITRWPKETKTSTRASQNIAKSKDCLVNVSLLSLLMTITLFPLSNLRHLERILTFERLDDVESIFLWYLSAKRTQRIKWLHVLDTRKHLGEPKKKRRIERLHAHGSWIYYYEDY